MHCTCLVHATFGWHGFRGFVLTAIGKMEVLATFPHFQNVKEVIRRYEGLHYTHLVYYYNDFYFETDWSRIRPLPSTTRQTILMKQKPHN